RRRRRALAWGGAALGLALGLGVYEGAGRLALAQQRSACAAEGAAVEAHYNDDVRARLRAALSIASPAHGATTAEKALAWLDRYADEWRAVRVETCEAAEIRGELDDAARERVDWCLEDKRTALAIYVDEFSGQRERAVHRAVTAAASLPAIATCNDVQLLSRLPAPPPALREQLRTTRGQLARARTVELAGDSREALALATSARARAEQLAWPPLYARAGVMLGRYQMHTGAYEDAEKSLERSYFEAASARAVDVEADAALELSFLLGEVVGRLDDGMRWSRLAGVALDEIGSGPSSAMRDAMIRAYRGNILMAMEQPEAGKLLIEESLAIVARTFPPDHPYVANAIHELARINHKLEHLEQSAAQYERALAMREEIYGPLHPGVSDTLNNLANVVGDLGDHARAVAMLERSLEIREGTFGPSHPVVAQTLNNLAIEYNVPGQRARARAAHERALAIREGTFGAEHRLVGESLVNLATVLHDDGDLDGARAQINRAIAVFERALGPEHPLMVAALSLLGSVHETAGALPEARAVYERALAIEEQRGGSSQLLMATLLGNLASVDLQQGALDAAERGARRALAIEETVRGPENAEAGSLTALLADVAMARGQTQEAIALNERALALLVRDAKLERRLADAQLSLARALRADPRERERTRELIGRALTIYRKDPAASAEMIREAEALLSAT
ncbi:MAG: tetratricopeptide repeat protein, partial [Myxococcales bacterium]|nr:tetratricopeptide repeat protein [Myxococcales bacterium]